MASHQVIKNFLIFAPSTGSDRKDVAPSSRALMIVSCPGTEVATTIGVPSAMHATFLQCSYVIPAWVAQVDDDQMRAECVTKGQALSGDSLAMASYPSF